MNTFITSDTHFCHNKDFLYTPRGYSSIEEHNEGIIQNWNSVVNKEDYVYHLGDIILTDIDAGIECVKRLNGHIFLYRGNHDTDNKIARLCKECKNIDFTEEFPVYASMLQVGKKHFYLSHYPTMTANIDDDKKPWHRVYNLCGHTHTQDKWLHWQFGIYHVELDAHNCYPVAIEDIVADIQGKNS